MGEVANVEKKVLSDSSNSFDLNVYHMWRKDDVARNMSSDNDNDDARMWHWTIDSVNVALDWEGFVSKAGQEKHGKLVKGAHACV